MFTAMTLCYGVTTADVLELINCQAFEGREGRWLVRHPYVQCFGEDHRVAGNLAWTTLVGFCLLYPSWTLIIIRLERKRRASAKRRSVARKSSGISGLRLATWSRAEESALKHFLCNGFRPAKAFFHEMNMVLILALASTNSVLGNGVRGTVVKILAIVIFVVLLERQRPYLLAQQWKLRVKALSLVVVAEASVLNCVATKSVKQAHLEPAVYALSILLAVLCVLLCSVLCVGYGLFLRQVAAENKKAQQPSLGSLGSRCSSAKEGREVSGLELTANPMGFHGSPMSKPKPTLESADRGNTANSELHADKLRSQKLEQFREIGAEHFATKTLGRMDHRKIKRKAFDDIKPVMLDDNGEVLSVRTSDR